MGIITNILAYIPVFFLIELFKRTSHRKSKIKKLQKLISSLSGTSKNLTLLSESEKVPLKNRKKFTISYNPKKINQERKNYPS